MGCDLCGGDISTFFMFLYKCSQCSCIYNYEIDNVFYPQKQALYDSENDSLEITKNQVYDTVLYNNYIPQTTCSQLILQDIFGITQDPDKLLKNCLKYLKNTEESKIVLKLSYTISWFKENIKQFPKLLFMKRNYYSIDGLEVLFSNNGLYFESMDVSSMYTTIVFTRKKIPNYIVRTDFDSIFFNRIINELNIMNNFISTVISVYSMDGYIILFDSSLAQIAKIFYYPSYNLEYYSFSSYEKYLIFSSTCNYSSYGKNIII